MPTFPDDSDGEALRLLEAFGTDFSKPCDLEFAIEVDDLEAASWAVGILEQNGLKSEIETFPDGVTVEVVVTHRMAPSYDEVVRFQKAVADLLKERGLAVAGWGRLFDPPWTGEGN